MKTVSERDEDGVEDEEGQRRCRRDEDGGVRTRSKKMVAGTRLKRMKTELADSRGTRKDKVCAR